MNISNTYFQEEVYQNLPPVLTKATTIFKNRRERDVVLFSLLLTLSIYYPNLYGIYKSERNRSNLFGMIIAPPASGKGRMKFAKKAVKKIDKASFGDKSSDPKYHPSLFIPGNASQSAVINKLNANSGKGIFFETEADTIADSFKQEWGDFSGNLRKGFHGEEITKLRIGGDENEVLVQNPFISACLSGTPNQVLSLIPSIENGLFSRFLFYFFPDSNQFEDPRPVSGEVDLESFFENIGDELLDIYNHIGDKEIKITLPENLWDRFVSYMKSWENTLESISKDFHDVVIRYGSIMYRIAMLLSVLRIGESKLPVEDTHEIDLESYTAAEYIMNSLFIHVQNVHFLYRVNNNELLPTDLIQLYSDLPKNVTLQTIDIFEKWRSYRFGQRTAYTNISKMTEAGLLTKLKNGRYMAMDENYLLS